jgi:hypothetical protein
MDIRIASDFSIDQRSKRHDSRNDCLNNVRVSFSGHILDLIRMNYDSNRYLIQQQQTGNHRPVNGRQSNILNKGQNCSAL